jgi:hypothetical protein
MRIEAALLALIVLCQSAEARSDRTNRVVCTEEVPVCARANVQRDETKVERSNRETRKVELLWSVPRWLNVVRIDETGSSILVEVQSTLEIQTNVTRSDALLAIYRGGELVREIKAAELFPSAEDLNTVKGAQAWARRLPSPETNVAKYLLATGRTVRVNLSTATLESE